MGEMIAWLIHEHFGWFLAVCAVAAAWLTALAMILEWAVGEIAAKMAVWQHNRMYKENWRE